jgi:hypothetical protein
MLTKFFGTGVATSKDWIKAAEADGMSFTAYDPSAMLRRNATYTITISTGGGESSQENHSGRRSLRSKARKEMSEFERTYPW